MTSTNTKGKSKQRSAQKAERVIADQKSVNALLNDITVDPAVVTTAAKKLFEDVNTPTSLGLFIALEANDYESLCTHSVKPLDYQNAELYSVDNQCCKLLAKYKGFRDVNHPACIAAAKQTFTDGEEACRVTNDLFRSWHEGNLCLTPDLDRIIPIVREIISTVLGDLDCEEWLDSCRFGPGAAVGSTGTSDYIKLSRVPAVTPEFELLAKGLLRAFPRWGQLMGDPVVWPGGKYSQVSKSFKTNRNIETQPLLNGFAQLGLGQIMRRRLKAVGVDLDSQDRNKYFSYLGSRDGTFGTLDLSNASDTISLWLCRALLPARWLFALEATRTSRIKVHGEYVTLERFSSMGNGFTFELETLIFYAISLAMMGKDVGYKKICVYGDDIIVPTEHFDEVARGLTLCGFTVNQNKSYKSGPFRESCGADWFRGHPVRPFYIKEVPTNVASLIALANGFKRVSRDRNRSFCYDRRYFRAWSYCLRRIPDKIRSKLACSDGAGQLVSFRKIPGIPLSFLVAVNPWVDDTIIESSIQRDGLRLQFNGKKRKAESLFVSLLTALYRIHVRSRSEVDDNSIKRIPEPGERRKSVMTYVERRDENLGRWKLAKYRIDSLIRHDTEVWIS